MKVFQEVGILTAICPVKMLLQDLTRKGPFCIPARSCKNLQCPARSCRILQEFYKNLAGILCKIPAGFLQNPTRSHRILQDLAGMQEKRAFSCKILQEHFYWVGMIIWITTSTWNREGHKPCIKTCLPVLQSMSKIQDCPSDVYKNELIQVSQYLPE